MRKPVSTWNMWLAALAISAFSTQAAAGSLAVKVVDSVSGKSVPHAQVCLHAGGSLVAAIRADAAGTATFDQLPARRLTLSISDKGFANYQRSLAPRSFQVRVTANLAPSQFQKPVCRLPSVVSAEAADHSSMQLTVAVDQLDQSSGKLRYLAQVDGLQPTHLRVSESPDFTGSRWLPYRVSGSYYLSREGVKTLYFQVRRRLGSSGSSLESRSSVVSSAVL